MAQQTAVEWLLSELQTYVLKKNDMRLIRPCIEKAKQMQEQQTIDAYKHGQNNEFSHLMVGKPHITGEEYFEQTYKTQAQ